MLTQDERAAVVAELAARPGHEKVRALLHRLIVDGLGAESRDIDFERRVPEVHGRVDALLGRTVLEFKSDLRRERGTAEEELTRYLTDRQGATGHDYVGLATDGADFVAYFLKHGAVVEAGRYTYRPAGPAGFAGLAAKRDCRRRIAAARPSYHHAQVRAPQHRRPPCPGRTRRDRRNRPADRATPRRHGVGASSP